MSMICPLLDDLPPARDQIGQTPGVGIGQRANHRLGRRDEVGDHAGIQRIGLGALAQRLGEGAHLGRIDHDHRQLGGGEAGGHDGFISAGRFKRDRARRERLQASDQIAKPGRVPRDREAVARRPQSYVQPVFRDVDPNNDGVHCIPSLRNRASLAAQATVRVQWNDGRTTTLPYGLDVPMGYRPSARHRTLEITR